MIYEKLPNSKIQAIERFQRPVLDQIDNLNKTMTYTKTEPYVGKYIMWKGKLAKIIAGTDLPTVTIEIQDGWKCPNCNQYSSDTISVVLDSPLWIESSEPVETI